MRFPLPEASDLAELNERLLAGCVASRSRTISGRVMTVGEASQLERGHLLPLAEERFPIDEILFPLIVDTKGRVANPKKLLIPLIRAAAPRCHAGL